MLRRILYKLYHIQQSLDEHAQAIRDQNKALVGLRKEQQKHEKALEEARSEQAKSRGAVMQKEKRIKKAEKALETQVRDAMCMGMGMGVAVAHPAWRSDRTWCALRRRSNTPSGSGRRQNRSLRS